MCCHEPTLMSEEDGERVCWDCLNDDGVPDMPFDVDPDEGDR